jgi:hypothetical protein
MRRRQYRSHWLAANKKPAQLEKISQLVATNNSARMNRSLTSDERENRIDS